MMQFMTLSLIITLSCHLVLADLDPNPSGSVFHSVPGSGYVSINFGPAKVSSKTPAKPKNPEPSLQYKPRPSPPKKSYPPVPRYDRYQYPAPARYEQSTLPKPKYASTPSYSPPPTTTTTTTTTTPKPVKPEYYPSYPRSTTTQPPLPEPLYYSEAATPSYPRPSTTQSPSSYSVYHPQTYSQKPPPSHYRSQDKSPSYYYEQTYKTSSSIPSPSTVPAYTHGPDVYLRPIYPRLKTTAKPQKKASKKSKTPTLYYSEKIKFFPRPKETESHDVYYSKSKPTVRPIRVKELSRIQLVPTSKNSEETRDGRANRFETSDISPAQFEQLSSVQIENRDREGRARESLPSGPETAFQEESSSPRNGRAEDEEVSSNEMIIDTNTATIQDQPAPTEGDESISSDTTTIGTLSGDETTKLPIELDNIDEVTSSDVSGEDGTEVSRNESAERDQDEGINVSQTTEDPSTTSEEGTSLAANNPEETTITNLNGVDGEDTETLLQSDVS